MEFNPDLRTSSLGASGIPYPSVGNSFQFKARRELAGEGRSYHSSGRQLSAPFCPAARLPLKLGRGAWTCSSTIVAATHANRMEGTTAISSATSSNDTAIISRPLSYIRLFTRLLPKIMQECPVVHIPVVTGFLQSEFYFFFP